MRTQYDLDSLAGLTLQLYQRGLDAWQPILVSQNGEGYQIVSGHRRQIALLLSLALRQLADAQEEKMEMTVEIVRSWLKTLVEELGSLEQLVAALRDKHGDHEIPAVPFNGSQKAEILALQSANYGGEQPDALDALYAALPDQSLSFDCLLALDDELHQAVGDNDDKTKARHGVIRQCYRLPPIPLPAAPLGY
jgi:hypothetical protein